MRPNMHQRQPLDARRLRHSRRAQRPALPRRLPVRVHYFLIIPAHAQHRIRAARQLGHRLARLRIPREHHAARRRVKPIRQRIQERLHMLRRRRAHLPIAPRKHKPRPNIPRANLRRLARQRPAPVHMNPLAQRMPNPRLPIVREHPLALVQYAPRNPLSQGRPKRPQRILLARALIPSAQQKARIVNIVVKVMMREKQVVNICRPQPRLHQLMRSRRPAIHHQLLFPNPHRKRRPKPRRRRRRRPRPQHINPRPLVSHNHPSNAP